MAASAEQVMNTINSACSKRGGQYAAYKCSVVSWDDVSRGTVGSSLSCWGANITDTYLKSKNGECLFTVRSDNWNEKLGAVSANDVALVASKGSGAPLQPVSLRTFLEQLGDYGSYAGLAADSNLSYAKLDAECSIRFQTTFVPVASQSVGQSVLQSMPAFSSGRSPAKLEFCTEAYNYNTMSDEDPRNLILLCTTQGVAVQQDGRGQKKLLHHAVDDANRVHRHWLEADETDHQVGGEQHETAEEREEALARGKATSSVIGTRAMGQRFNVLMTVQVPLKQKRLPTRGADIFYGVNCSTKSPSKKSRRRSEKSKRRSKKSKACSRSRSRGRRSIADAATGRSSAARVSRGSEYDVWSGLSVKAPERNESEHITITVVIYNTVADGVPSEEDVLRAIDDMEALYASTAKSGRLADAAFDFMKEPLKAQAVEEITTKLNFQPPSVPVTSFDVFPVGPGPNVAS
eukprot:TRINITY_DN4967_c1_g2_i1.p1 TRINITY_DN4967_c1_g2~~TRINITY_DN4967_c1_g2_i1.p1  ORF type:complete len:462 (+),score=61.23 TRINITY_DN4967_c1_g2_i1:72-1457(+)